MAKPPASQPPQRVLLVGGPDTGKTNYLGRLWASLRAGAGALRAPEIPDEIKYVEAALAHLAEGRFAPRSNAAEVGDFSARVVFTASDGQEEEAHIEVPDVMGEMWKRSAVDREIDEDWMRRMQSADGAVLFIRVMSDANVDPLDWVTCAAWMRGFGPPAHTDDAGADAPPTTDDDDDDDDDHADPASALPTQVQLTELTNFLEDELGVIAKRDRPRLAVVITAWDLAPPDVRSRSPMEFLQSQFPMFAGRVADCDRLEVEVFGCSIVGGDLDGDVKFKDKYRDMDIETSGYIVVSGPTGEAIEIADLTAPVAWVLGAPPVTTT